MFLTPPRTRVSFALEEKCPKETKACPAPCPPVQALRLGRPQTGHIYKLQKRDVDAGRTRGDANSLASGQSAEWIWWGNPIFLWPWGLTTVWGGRVKLSAGTGSPRGHHSSWCCGLSLHRAGGLVVRSGREPGMEPGGAPSGPRDSTLLGQRSTLAWGLKEGVPYCPSHACFRWATRPPRLRMAIQGPMVQTLSRTFQLPPPAQPGSRQWPCPQTCRATLTGCQPRAICIARLGMGTLPLVAPLLDCLQGRPPSCFPRQ